MSLLSGFKKQCLLSPDNIAVIEGNQLLNYAQLQQSLLPIISAIQSRTQKCERIAIAIDRGIDATRATLSTLALNACYIPLDLKNPDNRLNYITNDADVQCVLGKGHCPDWLDKPELWLDITQLPKPANNNFFYKTVEPHSMAVILYTSGSTGYPKGVALTHNALNNFSNWAIKTFDITTEDRIASLAPFHFDLSIFDLFSSLSSGASIHFIPPLLTMSPSRLTNWLSENKITTWYTVPSLLSFILLKGSLKTTPLPDLKKLLFAGEVFPTAQLIELCKLLPNIDFYNLYGPTETNVCCYWPVDRNRLNHDQPIPIGLPACNSILRISSNNELLVKSNNNLAGYWQRGKLIPALSAHHYYHTGDRVSLNENNEYCYHGRIDRMLKCSGYRVEPAEIEQVILQNKEILHCAVFAIKDSTSGQRPIAAIVQKKDTDLSSVIKKIKQNLPSYMHPSKFILLSSLPFLSNGKIDYQTLLKHSENK